MAMNIKNDRVQALAREAARRTGKTQTSVIEEALRAYLKSTQVPAADGEIPLEAQVAQVRRLVAELTVELDDHDRQTIHNDLLSMYDEQGLPR